MTDVPKTTDAPTFPILRPMNSEKRKKLEALGCPARIPLAVIAPHERQADRNHSQTLRRLAERGGLSASEAVAVLLDRKWESMTDEAAVASLNAIVSARHAGALTDER